MPAGAWDAAARPPGREFRRGPPPGFLPAPITLSPGLAPGLPPARGAARVLSPPLGRDPEARVAGRLHRHRATAALRPVGLGSKRQSYGLRRPTVLRGPLSGPCPPRNLTHPARTRGDSLARAYPPPRQPAGAQLASPLRGLAGGSMSLSPAPRAGGRSARGSFSYCAGSGPRQTKKSL